MRKVTAVIAFFPALILGFAGYFFATWGYLGLFMGEPNYGYESRYELMLVGGAIALVASLAIVVRSIVTLVRSR